MYSQIGGKKSSAKKLYGLTQLQSYVGLYRDQRQSALVKDQARVRLPDINNSVSQAASDFSSIKLL